MSIVLEILYLRAFGLEFLGRIESIIRLTIIYQLLYIFLVDIAPFTLTIRTILSTKGNALVKLYTQPLEGLDDIFLGTRNETTRIGILNPENKLPTMLACEKIVVKSSAHPTNVEGARGTWRKSYPYRIIVHKKNFLQNYY